MQINIIKIIIIYSYYILDNRANILIVIVLIMLVTFKKINRVITKGNQIEHQMKMIMI